MELTKIDYNLDINYKEILGEDWAGVLEDDLLNTPYMENLMLFLHERYKATGIFPKKKDIFNAFKNVGFGDIRVVVLCREPYNNPRSMGVPLANKDEWGRIFSPELISWLNGIEKTCYNGLQMYGDTTFKDIAQQGVFFMDVALTSEEGKEMEYKMHWRNFTRQVVKTICDWHPSAIFVLLGEEAKEFEPYIGENYKFYAKHPTEVLKKKEKFDASFAEEVNSIITMNNGDACKIVW